MNVDTGAFRAITDQLTELAAKVEHLERREQQREMVAELIAGGGARTAPRHLHAVRGGS